MKWPYFLEGFAPAIPGSAKQRIEKNVIFSILPGKAPIDTGHMENPDFGEIPYEHTPPTGHLFYIP